MTRKREPIPESQLAAAMMAYLTEWGWDCYPEAQMDHGSGRADIAAVRGPVLWVIECKVSFTLALLDQAAGWIGKANLISVAVPHRAHSYAAALFCRQNGIGTFTYDCTWSNEPQPQYVHEYERPRFFRDRHPNVFNASRVNRLSLHSDMKRYAPGTTSDKGYSTPWKRTMDAAAEFVAKNPGCTIKELVGGIDHHYSNDSSARGNLLHWLEAKQSVRLDRSQRSVRLYPLEAAA